LEIRLLRVLKASVEEINAHSQIDVYFIVFFNDVMFVLLSRDVLFVLLLILVSITDGN